MFSPSVNDHTSTLGTSERLQLLHSELTYFYSLQVTVGKQRI